VFIGLLCLILDNGRISFKADNLPGTTLDELACIIYQDGFREFQIRNHEPPNYNPRL
jgi:hypothetical protein